MRKTVVKSVNIKNEFHFFLGSSKYERCGSRAKLMQCARRIFHSYLNERKQIKSQFLTLHYMAIFLLFNLPRKFLKSGV